MSVPLSGRGRLERARQFAPRADPDARDELTAQELQIAQPAAEGLSNREIGQKLFVSHRTPPCMAAELVEGVTGAAQRQARVGDDGAAVPTADRDPAPGVLAGRRVDLGEPLAN